MNPNQTPVTMDAFFVLAVVVVTFMIQTIMDNVRNLPTQADATHIVDVNADAYKMWLPNHIHHLRLRV